MLKQWTHHGPVKAGQGRPMDHRRIHANTDACLALSTHTQAPSADQIVKTPPGVSGRKRSVVDTRSQPNEAECTREFPQYPVRTSEGQNC